MINRPSSLSAALRMDGDAPPQPRHLPHMTGELHLPGDPTTYPLTSSDLHDLGEIGSGNFGNVYKMEHIQTGRQMAVKRVRADTVNQHEQRNMLRELDTVIRAQDCDYIVKFYGAMFHEFTCWICMELMDISVDQFYKTAYRVNITIPESFIGAVTVSTINALSFLKDRLNMIHRDVKPSNILLDRKGYIKLCDFGISGQLEDSIAKTHNVGCKPYMAPERIATVGEYDIRSDVWALGITVYELSTGKFPYSEWTSPFHQLHEVIYGNAPVLNMEKVNGRYSLSLIQFVNECLVKEKENRPKYQALKESAFFQTYNVHDDQVEKVREEVGQLVREVIEKIEKAPVAVE